MSFDNNPTNYGSAEGPSLGGRRQHAKSAPSCRSPIFEATPISTTTGTNSLARQSWLTVRSVWSRESWHMGSRCGRASMGQEDSDRSRLPSESLLGASITRRSLVLAPIQAVAGKVTWVQLTFIAYSFTAAGPFGIEAAVQAAGPFYTLLGLLTLPVIYVIPTIVITTELAGMMPSAHGAALWVQRAYGNGVGYFNAVSFIATNLIEVAIYPTLFTEYMLATFFPQEENNYWIRVALNYSCLIVGTLIALFSARFVGHASTILSFLVVLPFIIGVVAGAKYLSWDKIMETQPIYSEPKRTYHWGVWASTLMWLFTGWRSLGNLGEEVSSVRDYIKGMPLALLLAVVTYFVPLVVAVCIPIPASHQGTAWEGGYMAIAFGSVLKGLGSVIAIAGAVGNLGLTATCMLCYPRMVWGAAERGWLPHFLTQRSPTTKVPHFAVAFHFVVAAVFAMFDFSILMRLQTIISLPAYILGMTSFVKLRWSEPEASRPFSWPKSFVGSVIVVAIPTLMFVGVFLLNLEQEWWMVAIGIGVDLLVVGMYWIQKKCCVQRCTETESGGVEAESFLPAVPFDEIDRIEKTVSSAALGEVRN